MRIEFSCAVHASDGKNGTIARISARPNGHRGRMAGKRRTCAETGSGSRAAEAQGAKRRLLWAGHARFALAVAKLQKNVSHVHATSSGALVCALILKKLLNVTVSATIEARPA